MSVRFSFMFQVFLAMEPTWHGWPVTVPCLSLGWEDSMSGFGSSGVRGSTSRTASSLGTPVGLLARLPSRGPLGTTGSKGSRVRWKLYEPFVTQPQGHTASRHTPLAGGVKSPSKFWQLYVWLMVTSSKRAYAIPKAAAPRAPAPVAVLC